jgi:hypothetical protein
MNNEILFLKYLDHQLSAKESSELEKMLKVDCGQRELFEAIKRKRQITLDAIRRLNPEGPIAVPSFESDNLMIKTEKSVKQTFRSNFVRYAAAVLFLVALPLTFWLLTDKKHNQNSSSKFSENAGIQMTGNEELDYYISPNRCWNKRQLVWTVTEINH